MTTQPTPNHIEPGAMDRLVTLYEEPTGEYASLPYGELVNFTGEITADNVSIVWLDVPYCSGSDYSGSLVERSNHKVWTEDLEDIGPDRDDGGIPQWYGYHGGYSTFGVIVRITCDDERVIDMLAALADYPLLSEDELGRMELDAQGEAWLSWAHADFQAELAGQFGGDDLHTSEDLTDAIDALTGSACLELFQRLADRANEYWVNEQGGEMWISLERVAAVATLDDLRSFLPSSCKALSEIAARQVIEAGPLRFGNRLQIAAIALLEAFETLGNATHAVEDAQLVFEREQRSIAA